MNTFWLRIRAPFATFRGFQAGVYRSTSPVMPPSAAYGLVLNLAGIEMRGAADSAITLIQPNLQPLRIAIGLVSTPEKNSLYQQLHGYRVGTDDKTKMMAALTKGAKYQIVPVRREILVDYEGLIGVQTPNENLREQVARGLRGELETQRYGLPFAGDNNFLFDYIREIEQPPAATRWYTPIRPNDPPRKGSCRLTVGIDRADNSKTTSYLYAPLEEQQTFPPDTAWTWTPYAPQEVKQ
jgi:CRISPR-associated protein Cas5t